MRGFFDEYLSKVIKHESAALTNSQNILHLKEKKKAFTVAVKCAVR